MKLRTVALLTAVAVLAALRIVGTAGPNDLAGLGELTRLRAPMPDATLEDIAADSTADALANFAAPGLPASVQNVTFQPQTLSYPVLAPTGEQIGTTAWRVVPGTGNCCENHLGATRTGRLLDFGGAYLNFSDDQGLTWKQVRPAEPLVGPEGTVVNAPGGDIVGVTWDPYTGDRVLAFKMDGTTGAWEYMYTALHTPFYDREWIAVIPGPHTIGGQTVPYITVLRGGWPSKSVWYYSLDGLHYAIASNKVLTQLAGGTTNAWLPTEANAEADWTQPISESSITPLIGGGALARSVDTLDPAGSWYQLAPGSMLWSRFYLGDGSDLPTGRLVQDSRGWAHLVDVDEGAVTYRLSKDGGRTWTSTTAALPPNHTVEDWDLRANGAAGVTSVAIHAHNGASSVDQDLVMRFATVCGTPELVRTHLVGKGDLNVGAGLGASLRFDFATTAILPDGKVATSIIDSAHRSPALAMEIETTYLPGYTPPLLSCGVPAP